VVLRVLKTFYPLGQNFFEFINPTPDLYGPFWIATTVIFLMAATGNFANWINQATQGTGSEWYFHYEQISAGAGTIYGYLIIMPLIIWGVCKYMEVKLSLVENLCVYGYSFFVYIPASIVMIIPSTKFDWLRWLIIAIAAVFSTLFLVKSYILPFKVAIKRGFIVLICIAVVNMGLALAFKLYFFTNDTNSPNNNSTSGSGSKFFLTNI